MKYSIIFTLLFCLSFINQNLNAQTYQWEGKQVTKKERDKKLKVYHQIFNKSFNGDNIITQANVILLSKLVEEHAVNGLALIIDVNSNNVIAKSGFIKKGKEYFQDTSLFDQPIAPGSLAIPMSAAMIMDNYGVTLNDTTNLEAGKTTLNGLVILDAEKHDVQTANLKKIIAESSNVGIAKLVDKSLKAHNYNLNLNNLMNHYVGNTRIIPNDSATKSQIPFQAFGYGVLFTPNEIFNFYKRIAQSDSSLFKQPQTLTQLQAALGEVAINGTAKALFRDAKISFAAKTGTVLVTDTKKGETRNQFISEFIGYDNQEHPKYACMVIIKCKPNSPNHFGASVAGPVFKSLMELAMSKDL